MASQHGALVIQAYKAYILPITTTSQPLAFTVTAKLRPDCSQALSDFDAGLKTEHWGVPYLALWQL